MPTQQIEFSTQQIEKLKKEEQISLEVIKTLQISSFPNHYTSNNEALIELAHCLEIKLYEKEKSK